VVVVVEMMGLEPTTPCLQSSRELAVCYAGKTLLCGDRKLSSYGVVSALLRGPRPPFGYSSGAAVVVSRSLYQWRPQGNLECHQRS
jgi:hypothetical protein